MSFKKWLALIIALIVPATSYANGEYQTTNPHQPYLNVDAINQIEGVTINPAIVLTQGIPFSILPSTNPLMLDTAQTITVASVNTTGGYQFLSGVTGRTIYPGTPTVMVSGTASAATSVGLYCNNGTSIGVWPIAELQSLKPITTFSSVSTVTAGTPLLQGCPSGSGIFVSVIGSSLATTTFFYVNMPYTVQ